MKVSKLAYCEHCDKDVEFNVTIENREVVVRGIKVTYEHKATKCKHCKKDVSPVSFGNENYLAMIDAYRARINLLTSKEIIEILNKRGLTQKQLAKLLCIGEKDITRYLKGHIQSKSIDNMLRFINDDVVYKRMKLILAN